MILDSICSVKNYVNMYPGFDKAFDFLRQKDICNLEDGEYEIDNRNVFAIVASSTGKGEDRAVLEAHDKYIDVQFTLEGKERIGWTCRGECCDIRDEYNSERDLIFYNDKVREWFDVPENNFAVFFRNDAHAPLAGCGEVRKVVIKVKIIN